MKVLVTGGAGFIGSHVVGALRARGDLVTVLDSLDDSYDPARKLDNLRCEGVVESTGALPVLAESSAVPRLVRADLRDDAVLDDVLDGVAAVVHMAALAGVRDSLADPLRYEDVNVRGTLRLLEAMRRSGCHRLVFASSSSVYGVREGQARFCESDPADRPVSPYAATKRAGELMCHAAHAAWGLDVTCLRFFTVYGPRQRPAMAIARFVSLALARQPLPLFGDGSSVRDYTYVGDIVRGVCTALDRVSGYELINLGCGSPISLDGLVTAIGQAAGVPVDVTHLPEQPGDVPRTHADIRRAAHRLDWRPEVPIVEGLGRYVAWVLARNGI